MSTTTFRTSPLHSELEQLSPTWTTVAGMQAASCLGDNEMHFLETVALCDLSFLPRLGLNGPGVSGWLQTQDIEVPAAMYELATLSDGSSVVRIGTNEVIIEGVPGAGTIDKLTAALATDVKDVFNVTRNEASLALAGPAAADVLAQTCSVLVRDLLQQALVYTRVAGVSAAVFQQELNGCNCVRLIFDPSYGIYMWRELLKILAEYDGGAVGFACLFPESQ